MKKDDLIFLSRAERYKRGLEVGWGMCRWEEMDPYDSYLGVLPHAMAHWMLQAAIGIRKLVLEKGLDRTDGKCNVCVARGALTRIASNDTPFSRLIAEFLFRSYDKPSGMDLHFGMFIPTLLGQGSEEQVRRPSPP